MQGHTGRIIETKSQIKKRVDLHPFFIMPAGKTGQPLLFLFPGPAVLLLQALAEFLANHPKVAWVGYPGLPSDQDYELAQKYMPNGTCGVVSFEVKGGRAAAEKFMQNLRIFAIETHVADARSCCLHPASSTHRQMTDEELLAAGVPGSLVRMSCGLENTRDLIEDVAGALEAIMK